MSYKHLFEFNVKWNYRAIFLFVFLLLLPNILGMINLDTPFGFKIHFFQLGVIMAAVLYGPYGGLLSGFVGAFYSAMITGNPYIIGGNMILGFFAGFFIKQKINTVLAVMIAFCIQVPWLFITDYYLVHLPLTVIYSLIGALAASNLMWGIVSHWIAGPIRKTLK